MSSSKEKSPERHDSKGVETDCPPATTNPEIEEKIVHKIDKILENVDPVKKEEVKSAIIQISRKYSGPLPPPEALAQYNKHIPNAGERIMAMAEKEQEHRHAMQRKDLLIDEKIASGAVERIKRGQILGFVIALIFLAASVLLIIKGHGVEGTILASVDLVALVGIFVINKFAKGVKAEEPAGE